VSASSETIDYIRAVPLVAITAAGFGPGNSAETTSGARKRLESLRSSSTGVVTALDTAGLFGRQLLGLIAALGGTMTAEQLTHETANANKADLQGAIHRLCAAGLLEYDEHERSTLHMNGMLMQWWHGRAPSMEDEHALTSGQLGSICRKLQLKPPSRKKERIDVISDLFSDTDLGATVFLELSSHAKALLTSIADEAGAGTISAEVVGITHFWLMSSAGSPYPMPQHNRGPEAAALDELVEYGIVGVDAYEGELWVWREAWPMLARPYFPEWPAVTQPRLVAQSETDLRLPPLMGLVERALQHWGANPPAGLKNGEQRLAKTEVRRTAKLLGTSEEVVELISRVLLGVGLLLRNVISTSGRGRTRDVKTAWMIDPDLMEAWTSSPIQRRWLRVVDEWTRPGDETMSDQLLANRHLLMWELLSLEPDVGFADGEQVERWIEDRYEPVGAANAVRSCLADLVALGLITGDGEPIALTALGRLALTDSDQVVSATFGSADEAVVQADHTIVAPPDLNPDVAARLVRIADIESDGGAQVYRLSESLVTTAVQNGDNPDEICRFLEQLSPVPIPDTVRRLVEDAAKRVGKVKVMAATTVVVTTDPADLITACAVKVAKLEAVAPTVAITNVAAAKVRAALERRGLAPDVIVGTDDAPEVRRSSDEAAALEARAKVARDAAERSDHAGFQQHARRLTEEASLASDPSARMKVTGPLTLTPDLARVMARTTGDPR